MRKQLIILLVPITLLLGGHSNLHADLLGTDVTVENIFAGDTFDGPTSVTVTGGVELVNFGGQWDIDIGNSTVRLFNFAGLPGFPIGGDDEYLFTELDWGDIEGQIIDAQLSTLGLFSIPPVLNFGGDFVSVTTPQGTINDANAEMLIELEVQHVTTQPEPMNIAIWLIVGLVGVRYGCSRKHRLRIS